MKKIIIIFMMFIISSCSYYGKVNENGERVTSFENVTQEEIIIQNEILEEKQDDTSSKIENVIEQEENETKEEIKQNTIKENDTEIVKQEIKNSKTNENKETNKIQEKIQEETKIQEIDETKSSTSKISTNSSTKEDTDTNTNQNQSTNNIPKCSHSDTNWYSSKAEAEAIYNAEIKKWGDKWTNYEIDNDTYYKNCPDGYEVFSCPYCNKWTINLYY